VHCGYCDGGVCCFGGGGCVAVGEYQSHDYLWYHPSFH